MRASKKIAAKSVEYDSQLIERIMTFSARKPLLSCLFLLCLSLISLGGLSELKLDTSTDSMLSVHDPMIPVYNEVIKEFGSDNISLIHFQHPQLFSIEKLKILEDVTYALQDLAAVEKVESLFTTISIRDSEWGLEIAPLINSFPETEEELATIKDNALYSPLLRGNQLSADGTKAAIMVTLRPSFRDPEFSSQVYQQLEATIAPLRSEFDQVFQMGTPRIDHDFSTGIFADMPKLAPFAFSSLILCLIVMLRTWLGVFLPLLTAALSILWTAGLLGYMGIPVNLLISILPTLIIVVGSTEDTHMLSSYLQGLNETKQNRFLSVRFMATRVGLPIFLTSFTTIVGFLSNTLSDITLIKHFGMASSLAMFANLIATVLVLPLFLSWIGPKKSEITEDIVDSGHWLAGIITGLERLTQYHEKKILYLFALCSLCCMALMTQISFNNDPLSFFKSENKIIADSQVLHENLAGMQVFFLTLHAPLNTDFKDPLQLQKIEKIQQTMQQQGVYDKITSINDYLKLVHREMHQGQAEFYRLPESRDLVEQYLLLFQRNDIERVISADAKRVNLIVRHNISNSSLLNEHLTQLKQQIEQFNAGGRYSLTSKNLMINQAAETLFVNQQQSLVLLILVVCVLIAFLYSSITAGIVALIPNIIPILVMFGAMGLLNIPLNPGTALVSVIAIGIAIDDTIHILSTYNRECRLDGDQNAAMNRAIRSEAIPVISTSIALAIGFFSHIFSSFHIITQFGLLSALTMLVAMLTDLLLTPILFKRIRLVSLLDILEFKMGKLNFDRSPLFADMSRMEIKRMILLSQVNEYKAGETVIQQGKADDTMFVILQGRVEVIVEYDGQEKKIARLARKGDTFGEAAYAANVPRTASVRVTKDSEPLRVILLNQEKVSATLRFYPRLHAKLNHNISKLLAQRLATQLLKE